MWESLTRRQTRAGHTDMRHLEGRLYAAADVLRTSGHTIVLTGAGISTPSGIPDFRSAQSGLWSSADPMEIASLWSFHRAPARFYEWIRPVAQALFTAQPNPAHLALAQLEAAGRVQRIITQNIDDLHQKAGAINVVELHGHLRSASCLECRTHYPAHDLWLAFLQHEMIPHCPACDAILKPDVILFGEPPPYQSLRIAQEDSLHCDVMLVVGSSLEVEPAADLPFLARRRGAKIVVVNFMPTPIDNRAEVVIQADAAYALPRLVQLLTAPT
jgi:NAD-dependent deacetylase